MIIGELCLTVYFQVDLQLATLLSTQVILLSKLLNRRTGRRRRFYKLSAEWSVYSIIK